MGFSMRTSPVFSNPAATIIDLTDNLSPRRCQQWLNQMRGYSADHRIHGLIDDVSRELRELGQFGAELTDVVVGALASIEAAFELAPAQGY